MDQSKLDLKELLEQARIFISEKMYDDAKKTLRRILIYHPEESIARSELERIYQIEIEDILLSHSPNASKSSVFSESPEEVLKKLEIDYDIKVAAVNSEQNFKKQVHDSMSQWSEREKIDLGLAFLMSECFECATDLFASAARHEHYSVEATYLQAYALIESGQTAKAASLLEPHLQDLTLAESTKQDFLYLCGKAFERAGDAKRSREYYKKVFALNTRYRDVALKVK